MIIIAIDVSYCSLGLVVIDTDSKEILDNKTITFKNYSALNKKDKEVHSKISNHSILSKMLDNSKKSEIKSRSEFMSEMWKNYRLYEFNSILNNLKKKYKYDVVISENQFSSIGDVVTITRLASVSEDKMCDFIAYYPSSWRKILFGNGKLMNESKLIKEFTKEKMITVLDKCNFIKDGNVFNIDNFNSGDEIDAFALGVTYMFQNDILDAKYLQDIKYIKENN